MGMGYVRILVFILNLSFIFIITICNVKEAHSQTNNISDIFQHAGSSLEDSPSFNMLELEDSFNDAIELSSRESVSRYDGDIFKTFLPTDISSVNYFSEGDFLTSILWTYSSVNEKPLHDTVNYGMYIDADFDTTTGFGGIDYKMEISWQNSSKKWFKTLEKWSTGGDPLVISKEPITFEGFSGTGKGFVVLETNLEEILSPQKYNVLFYAEYKITEKDSLITDFTSWITVPSQDISPSLNANQDLITLKPGEIGENILNITSPVGYESNVNLSYFLPYNDSVNVSINPSDFPLPSSGKISIPIIIKAWDTAVPRTLPITIVMNASVGFQQPIIDQPNFFIVSPTIIQKSLKTFIFLIHIQPPDTINEHLNNLRNEFSLIWRDNKDIVILITGIFLTPFGAWAFDKLIKRRRSEKIRRISERN